MARIGLAKNLTAVQKFLMLCKSRTCRGRSNNNTIVLPLRHYALFNLGELRVVKNLATSGVISDNFYVIKAA